ncbi:MAG: bacterial Ig-like domain-containing protein, partial [Clostridiales bacterium]|nr:bacterial Ig-like domain-containing protein [Clostridiales bacterium]
MKKITIKTLGKPLAMLLALVMTLAAFPAQTAAGPLDALYTGAANKVKEQMQTILTKFATIDTSTDEGGFGGDYNAFANWLFSPADSGGGNISGLFAQLSMAIGSSVPAAHDIVKETLNNMPEQLQDFMLDFIAISTGQTSSENPADFAGTAFEFLRAHKSASGQWQSAELSRIFSKMQQDVTNGILEFATPSEGGGGGNYVVDIAALLPILLDPSKEVSIPEALAGSASLMEYLGQLNYSGYNPFEAMLKDQGAGGGRISGTPYLSTEANPSPATIDGAIMDLALRAVIREAPQLLSDKDNIIAALIMAGILVSDGTRITNVNVGKALALLDIDEAELKASISRVFDKAIDKFVYLAGLLKNDTLTLQILDTEAKDIIDGLKTELDSFIPLNTPAGAKIAGALDKALPLAKSIIKALLYKVDTENYTELEAFLNDIIDDGHTSYAEVNKALAILEFLNEELLEREIDFSDPENKPFNKAYDLIMRYLDLDQHEARAGLEEKIPALLGLLANQFSITPEKIAGFVVELGNSMLQDTQWSGLASSVLNEGLVMDVLFNDTKTNLSETGLSLAAALFVKAEQPIKDKISGNTGKIQTLLDAAASIHRKLCEVIEYFLAHDRVTIHAALETAPEIGGTYATLTNDYDDLLYGDGGYYKFLKNMGFDFYYEISASTAGPFKISADKNKIEGNGSVVPGRPYTVTVLAKMSFKYGSSANDTWFTFGEADVQLTLPNKALEGIKVTALPTTQYVAGDTLDLNGMVVTATYKSTDYLGNVTESSSDVTDYTASPPSETKLTAGSHTITVNYTDSGITKSDSFTVTVGQAVVRRIEIASPPTKTEYTLEETLLSTFTLFTSDLEVNAIYSDGTSSPMTTDYTIEPINPQFAGEVPVKVIYNGDPSIFTTFSITITGEYSLRVSPGEDFSNEIFQGGSIGGYSVMLVSGGALDTTTTPSALSSRLLDASEYDLAADTNGGSLFTPEVPGVYDLYVITKNAPDGISRRLSAFLARVTVKAIVLEKIELDYSGVKLEYVDGEIFDPTNLVVTAMYNNGTRAPADGYTLSPTSPLSTGMTSVIVSYTKDGVTKTAAIPITVNPRKSDKASIVSVSVGTLSGYGITVPYGTVLAELIAAITTDRGATFKVYQPDGVTHATDLASGYLVIVTAEDGVTT